MLNRVDTKTFKKEVESKLNAYTTTFYSLEASGFEADWKKGELLLKAQSETDVLEDKNKCWTKWVRQDLGLALRTAQRYRDVVSFYGEAHDGIPLLKPAYRAKLAMTKLDLLAQLWNAKNQQHEVPTLEFKPDAVLLTKKGAEPVDAVDVSVRDLRAMTPRRTRKDGSGADTDTQANRKSLKSDLAAAKKAVKSWESLYNLKAKECEALTAEIAVLRSQLPQVEIQGVIQGEAA
jgi:hypothetical protein